MFPIRHRRNRSSGLSSSPRVTDEVSDVVRVVPVDACTRRPGATLRDRASGPANRGRIIDVGRRLVLMVAVAGVLFGSPTWAADNAASAQHMVRQVTSRIVDELELRRDALQDDPQRLYELVDRLVLPHFDFERMSRRVLGKRWKSATPEQRSRFVSAFRTLLVRTYTLVLSQYEGQTMTYFDPVPRKRHDEIVIPVQIDLTGSDAVRIAYVIHRSGSDWKVFDVAVDGVSLVTNYRSSFRSEVARHGIEGLIARLESKNSATN